jgi:hypothetical protein
MLESTVFYAVLKALPHPKQSFSAGGNAARDWAALVSLL